MHAEEYLLIEVRNQSFEGSSQVRESPQSVSCKMVAINVCFLNTPFS